MSAAKLLSSIGAESADTISVRQQLLQSLRDPDYRHAFVNERVRSSIALQIRALRDARELTQKGLGDVLGMAQTWVSKLENPEYGKVTVATLLRLAEAFDTDLEIKFRPFSRSLDSLPTQGTEYFSVPSFDEEFGERDDLSLDDLARVKLFIMREEQHQAFRQVETGHAEAKAAPNCQYPSDIPRIPPNSATLAKFGVERSQYGAR